MRDGLLHLGAVAMGALHLVGIVFLEAQMHFERPVTGTTIIIIGWHILSFIYVYVLKERTLPEGLCKDSASHDGKTGAIHWGPLSHAQRTRGRLVP
jgi:hypothetical protein